MSNKFQPRISMITLGVHDMEKAVAFYRDGLGFPQLESPPTVAFFTLNGTWLGLFSAKALAGEAGVEFQAGEQFNRTSLGYNVASEEEVDQMLLVAQRAGATLTAPAKKMHWGGYSGYFQDPEGHIWEVAYNPFMWVGPPEGN